MNRGVRRGARGGGRWRGRSGKPRIEGVYANYPGSSIFLLGVRRIMDIGDEIYRRVIGEDGYGLDRLDVSDQGRLNRFSSFVLGIEYASHRVRGFHRKCGRPIFSERKRNADFFFEKRLGKSRPFGNELPNGRGRIDPSTRRGNIRFEQRIVVFGAPTYDAALGPSSVRFDERGFLRNDRDLFTPLRRGDRRRKAGDAAANN